VGLIVADIDLVTAIAGGHTIRKLNSFHDAKLMQDVARLLTEDDHSLNLALHDDDVAESIHRHSTGILQDVRAELPYESTVACEYLHLHKDISNKSGSLLKIMQQLYENTA